LPRMAPRRWRPCPGAGRRSATPTELRPRCRHAREHPRQPGESGPAAESAKYLWVVNDISRHRSPIQYFMIAIPFINSPYGTKLLVRFVAYRGPPLASFSLTRSRAKPYHLDLCLPLKTPKMTRVSFRPGSRLPSISDLVDGETRTLFSLRRAVGLEAARFVECSRRKVAGEHPQGHLDKAFRSRNFEGRFDE